MTATRFTLGLLTAFLTVSLAAAADTKGKIVKIDPAKKELVIETGGLGVPRGQVMSFTLGADTKVEVGLIAGKEGTLQSLYAGQRVWLEFAEKGGQRVVTKVSVVAVLSPPPPGGTAVAAAPTGEEVKGALRHIGFTEREIIVAYAGPQGGEAYSAVMVPAEAKILRDGKPIRFEDLKDEEGIIVETEKEKKNGRRVARTVQAGVAVVLPPDASDVKFGVGRIRQLIQMPKQLMSEGNDTKLSLPIDPELLRKSQGFLDQVDRILEMVELGQKKR